MNTRKPSEFHILCRWVLEIILIRGLLLGILLLCPVEEKDEDDEACQENARSDTDCGESARR